MAQALHLVSIAIKRGAPLVKLVTGRETGIPEANRLLTTFGDTGPHLFLGAV
jgi:hypothetical protein